MSRAKTVTTFFSLVLLSGIVILFSLLIAWEASVIDLSADPAAEGPTNTTGVPEVTASQHPDVNGEQLEIAIYEEVNERRIDADLEPLVHSERVRLIARLHSKDMADRNFFSHTNPDGDGSRERHSRYNGCEHTNENIFKWPQITTYDPDEISNEAVDWWANSPGHNSNMMSEYRTVTGVGVHVTDNGTLYVTQDFCREHPNA